MTRSARTFAWTLAVGALLGAGPAVADDGGQMYGKKCLACHGLDGAGDKPLGRKVRVPDLRRSTLSQAEVERIIADGKGKMLPYKDKLSAEQISAIAVHVMTALRPPQAGAAPAAPPAAPVPARTP